MDSADLARILASSALVLLMTPGLAFFCGGLVRGKNVNATIMYSLTSMGLVGVVWVLWGYSLDFAGGTVVHISSGIAALAAAMIIGKRVGYGEPPMPPPAGASRY